MTSRTARLNQLTQALENQAHADAVRINAAIVAAALAERTAPGIAPIAPAQLAALFAELPSAAWAALASLTDSQLVDQAIEYTIYLEAQGTERKWIAVYDCWVARLAARAALVQAEAEALAAHEAVKTEADAAAAPDYATYAVQTEAIQTSAAVYFDRRVDRECADAVPADAAIAEAEAQLAKEDRAWADLLDRAEQGALEDDALLPFEPSNDELIAMEIDEARCGAQDFPALLGDGWVLDSDPAAWSGDRYELAIYTLQASDAAHVEALARALISGPLRGEWWDGAIVEELPGHCYRLAFDTTKIGRSDPIGEWDRYKGWFVEGSAVRSTNQAGPGTLGTRKYAGLGPVLLAWR